MIPEPAGVDLDLRPRDDAHDAVSDDRSGEVISHRGGVAGPCETVMTEKLDHVVDRTKGAR
jgi:hypothetical protein